MNTPSSACGFLPRVLLASLLALAPAGVRAQQLSLGDPLDAYARLLQLQGVYSPASLMVRPVPVRAVLEADSTLPHHPWAAHLAPYRRRGARRGLQAGLLDAQLSTYYNTARPFGQNDGAVWQGKGGTVALQTGAFLRWGPVSAAVRPLLIHTRNADFPLSRHVPERNLSSFATRTQGTVDMPQRFGVEPFSTFDLGASYVRVDYRALAAGLSNENLWWGPGVRNAIILSNNAPGVPHAFVGTGRPADIWIGRLEGRWIWGEMQESDYFDHNPDNDTRFMTGIVLAFQPRPVPGLFLGAARVFNRYAGDLTARDYLAVFGELFKVRLSTPDNPSGNDDADQMLSLFARWVFPESAFEVYGELAKGDHNWDIRDVLVQPEHARGYTLGFQKLYPAGARRHVRFLAEVTQLGANRTVLTRSHGATFFYAHSRVIQGFSQRGQIVGAGIGPGSNGQHLQVDLYAPRGRLGAYVFRLGRDNDRYYAGENATNAAHEVEFGGGVEGVLFAGRWELGGGVVYGNLLNFDYIFKNDISNLNLSVALRRPLTYVR